MSYTIRAYNPLDEAEKKFFERLQVTGFGYVAITPMLLFYAKVVYGNVTNYVIEDDQHQLCGMFQTWGRGKKHHLSFISVDHRRQRQGIGRAIMQYIIQDAWKKNKEVITYHTRHSNTGMQTLGERLGFKRVKSLWRYYGDESGYLYKKTR